VPVPKPYTEKPSLDQAFERIARATEHFEEPKRAIEPLKFKPKPGGTMQNSSEGKHISVMVFDHPTIPLRVGTIIGDVCYNLRAALDYLVFNLSALDSGLDHQGTQFPIEDRAKDFRKRVEARAILGGMNSRHRAMIEGLQPYKGSKWSKTLKIISNPDKHRALTATGVDARVASRSIEGEVSDLGVVSGPVMSTKFADGKPEMHTEVVVTTLILFADETPVVSTLEELKAQVTQVLQAFKSEFK
jgi:hypothetical protein